MLGRKSGFGALVKVDTPHITVTHCLLHRHALATKTFPPKFAEVSTIEVECVKYVRNSALKHRIFKELCNKMGSEFEVLLYYSNAQWLSRGKVLNHIFAFRVELAVFLRELLVLAYMGDIFRALNHLIQRMQDGGVNIIEAEEHLKAFKKNRTMETANR